MNSVVPAPVPSSLRKTLSKRKKALKSLVDRSPHSKSPATAYPDPETATTDGGEFNMRLLSDAAVRFPHLISEKPLCGLVSDIETSSSNDNRASIWLSQDFMVSASLRPQSLVSVALAASDKQPLSLFPLYNFEECNTEHPGIDYFGSISNEAGCYFAIATVLLSSKVQNNRVRLSWSLYCTMGFPAIGQSLFISSVGDFSSCLNDSSINSSCHLYLHKCKNLNLNLLPITSQDNLPTKASSAEFASILNGHGKNESPKTPSFSKLPTTGTTPPRLKNFHASSLGIRSSDFLDVSALDLVLTDERSKVLYEKFVSSWLCGRFLLDGNLVTSPVCGNFLFSSVESPDELTTSCSSQTPISKVKNNALLNEDDRATSLDMKYIVLYVEAKTQISFSVPTSTSHENSSERSFSTVNLAGCINEKEPNDISRLGGLSKEFAALEKVIKFSFAHKDPFLRYTGVLLHGPPGTGKTTLVSCCVRSAGVGLFVVNGHEIVSQYYGESEQALHNIFDSARKAAPAVVFIDELDAIAPSRITGGKELSLRMLAILLKLMDDIKRSYGILVIAATNCPDNIDPALRRPGRFEKEIEIGRRAFSNYHGNWTCHYLDPCHGFHVDSVDWVPQKLEQFQ